MNKIKQLERNTRQLRTIKMAIDDLDKSVTIMELDYSRNVPDMRSDIYDQNRNGNVDAVDYVDCGQWENK